MNHLEELKNNLSPLIRELEAIRKRYHVLCWLKDSFFTIIFLGVILLPAFTYFKNAGTTTINTASSEEPPLYSMYLVIFLCFAVVFLISLLYAYYKNKYKKIETIILTSIFPKLAPGFQLDLRKQINSNEVSKSGLFPIYKQVFQSDESDLQVYNKGFGLLEGRIADVNIAVGDLKIINKSFFGSLFMYVPLLPHVFMIYHTIKSIFTKSRSIEHVGIGFSGTLVVAKFNKSFSGTTVVLPDGLESKIGFLAKTFQSLNFTRRELVNLENPEFENTFVVYGSDQIEARYLLSNSLMERILRLGKKINRSITLSFANKKLYIAIQDNHGFFSIPQQENLLEKNIVEAIGENILTVIDIVEDLNLNRNIWR